MPEKPSIKKASASVYIEGVLKNLSKETHKRIIKAFKGEDPVRSMEAELGEIVMEIVNRED